MDPETARTARDSLDLAFQMSNILETGLDRHTLSILIALCDMDLNTEALAAIITELRTECLPISPLISELPSSGNYYIFTSNDDLFGFFFLWMPCFIGSDKLCCQSRFACVSELLYFGKCEEGILDCLIMKGNFESKKVTLKMILGKISNLKLIEIHFKQG